MIHSFYSYHPGTRVLGTTFLVFVEGKGLLDDTLVDTAGIE